MEVSDLISPEVWERVRVAMSRQEHWAAYNNTLLFIHKDDIQFFSNPADADEYADQNFSDLDKLNVIRIDSLDDFKQKVEAVMPGVKYVPPVNESVVMEKQRGYFPKAILNERKKIIMNNENLEYLSNQLKFLGFGEGLAKQLEEKMKEGNPEFSLNDSREYDKDKMEAVIHFRHSVKDGKDNYFCNSYIATLKGAETEKDKSQFIYVNGKGQNITFKESCNLLNGRSSFKEITPREGSPYKAWQIIDHENIDMKTGYPKLRQFGSNYGFNLKEAVERLPFKALKYPDQYKTLMKSLEKGNRPETILMKDGKEVKVFLEANPRYKTMNMYDKDGVKMYYPMEKVAQKYGMAPADATKLEASQVNEPRVKYQKKDLLAKNKPSNGLIDKNPKKGVKKGQKLK